MCCPSRGRKGKHTNRIPRKSQENAGAVLRQSRDNPVKRWVYCVSSFILFPALKNRFPYMNAGESNRPLTPILLKSSATTPPIPQDFCESMLPLGRQSYIHHRFVSWYASRFYRDAFAEVLGSGVVGTLLKHAYQDKSGGIYLCAKNI